MDEASAFLDIASILVEAKSVAILPGGEDSQHDEQSLEVLRERDLLFAPTPPIPRLQAGRR